MAVFEWSADLEIGVFELDLQHRSLVAIANQFHDAVESGRPEHTIQWILDELLLYTKMHFETEEKYMRRYEHEQSSVHKSEHAEMLKAMRRFKRKLKAGEDIADEVLDFLGAWLAEHLTGLDRSLGESFKAGRHKK